MDTQCKSGSMSITNIELLTDVALGFVFWCLFEGFAPMIWFYPLNQLEISGYEAYAVAFCSPVLFVWPMKSLFQNRWVTCLLRCGTLVGLGSFQASSTYNRLVTLAVGVACAMLVLCASLYHVSAKQRYLTTWGVILGKLVFVSSRVWFTSFVPTWWNDQSNSMVVTVSTMAVLHKTVMGHDGLPADDSSEKKPGSRPSSVLTGIGLASLMYVSNAIFGEVSLVTRWTVSGFPNTGPMPYPWGAVVFLGLLFGVMLSPCKHVTQSYVWWLIGSLSFTALYLLDTWWAFTGGVVLAVYTMSLWPMLLEQASLCRHPALTLALLGLFYVVEILFSVWTVAYNFVPGGVYTREHTGWLIAFLMGTLGLALFSYRRNMADQKSKTSFIETSSGKMPNQTVSICLCLILLGGLGGFVYRYPAQSFSHTPITHPKADFTAAVWTFHFGYDNLGWPSMERAAEMLRNTGADVISLLESDASKPFLGNNDLGLWLAEKLQMHVDFGVSTRDHTWGNLLLSKYPIVKSKPIRLPSPEGELAPALAATVNMTGHLVDFVVTHMGNDKDRIDRRLQARELAKELKHAENPVVFLGYVTSNTTSSEYMHLTGNGNVLDIDVTDFDRWCEYIFYRGLIRQGYARISHAELSDTELQMARFRIPQDLKNFKDNNKIVIDPTEVQEKFRFTKKFGDFMLGHNEVSEHRYHMDTPKYFNP